MSATFASTSKSSAGRSTDTLLTAIELGSLHCIANQNNATAWARYCTFDEQQVVFCINTVQSQVLSGCFDVAHTAWKLFTLEDAAWSGCATDRSRLTVVFLRTVGSK